MKIGNKELGKVPYIIAEAGQNAGGSIERARELIKAAADACADAIKFQTYTADELVVKGTPRFWNYYEDDGKDQWQAYEDIKKFSYDDYPELMKYCEEFGIEFLSTPFSFEAADKLNEMGMKAFKIASSDMSTLPFLRHVARFGKPILLSTGAATMEEVRESVRTIRDEGNDQIVVMQCTLCYPTTLDNAQLGVIQQYKKEFPDLVIGLSDHTLPGKECAIVTASTLGAAVIEKHFTTDNTLKGNADHWLSITPDVLKERIFLARGMFNKWHEGSYYGVGTMNPPQEKKVLECEKETRLYDKRSVVTKCDLKKGEEVTEDKLTYKRPGTGIWPNQLDNVLGKNAAEDIPANTILQWKMFA